MYSNLNSANTSVVERHALRMSDHLFRKYARFIHDQCGIKLVPEKKIMLETRLNKRLRTLEIDRFEDYLDLVQQNSTDGIAELTQMIDRVTTNKTDFFREDKHFRFLVEQLLPQWKSQGKTFREHKLKVWSAGCSSGEEPYTLAMVLDDYFSSQGGGDFAILGSDISTRILDRARQAIYPEVTVETVPLEFRKKYLLRGKKNRSGLVRVIPELRRKCSFQHINLNEGRRFSLKDQVDIIFCRNVVIYFDKETQQRLFEKFYTQLRPGGSLFIGHSETLNGLRHKFTPVEISVYREESD